MYEDAKTNSQVKNLNKLLKSFFNYAVDERYISKTPCGGKKIAIPGEGEVNLDENEDDIVVFTSEEIQHISNDLEDNQIQALILLKLGTSIRQRELLALKWSDLSEWYKDLKVQRNIKQVKIIAADETSEYKTVIQTHKTKGSFRTVPIQSTLVPILEKHRTIEKQEKAKAGPSYIDNDFVFTTNYSSPSN
ncbi:hypothetical protein HMPREF1982_02525 [Clostridiales bacterium oral taxon 876 str. F0540]|nr:hypothetical protein HMPREF1982_02525 [Clostridiales bacterium oral taxon 876 str. F0540]